MTRVKREMRFRNCDKGGALGLVGAAFHAKQCNAMPCTPASPNHNHAGVLVEGWFSTWPFSQCDVKSHALMHAGETVRMPLSGAQGTHILLQPRLISQENPLEFAMYKHKDTSSSV